jgi:hypothetical protein
MKTATYVPIIMKKSDNMNYGFDKYVRPTQEGNPCWKLELAFHILSHRSSCTLGYNLISIMLCALCTATDTRVFVNIGEVNKSAVMFQVRCKDCLHSQPLLASKKYVHFRMKTVSGCDLLRKEEQK